MRLVRILFPIAVLGLLPSTLAAQTNDATAVSLPSQDAASPLDMPIEKIADINGGCAILDKDFPGLRDHPMYPYFKAMTLNQIAAMSKGQITPDMLAQARIDLAALKPAPAPGDAPTDADMIQATALSPPSTMTVAAPAKTPAPNPTTVATVH